MSSIGWHHFSRSTWMIPGGNSQRRRELNAEKALPSLSEIQARLGVPLANIFFQSMTESTARNQLGLAPPLKGPQQQLWVSPTDVLEGKMVLTEPDSPHSKLALTHQYILNIGAGYESALEAETQKKIKTAIEEAEKRMKQQKEEAIDLAVQKTRTDEHDKYVVQLKMFQKQADEIIQKSVLQVRDSLLAEAETQKEEALKNLQEDIEKQMLDLIYEKEQYIAKKYNFKFNWEFNKSFESYQEKITHHQKKWAGLFEDAKRLFQKEINRIRIELQAKHMNDVLRLHQEMQLEINKLKEGLNKTLENVSQSNAKKVEEKEAIILHEAIKLKEKDIKINILKEKMNDLALEFQKFIKYVLQQKSAQGEYLLSLEEIMKDEAEKAFESSKDENLLDKKFSDESNGKAYLAMALIIETVIEKYEKSITEEEPLEEIINRDIFPEATFEERIEREREINKAINLVGDETKHEASSETLNFIKERTEAMKKVLSNYPSIVRLFLATKSSGAQQCYRSYQHKHYQHP